MSPVEIAGLSVGGRREPATPQSPPRAARVEKEIRATPFKRSRSRVFYASQSESWDANDNTKDKSVRRDLSFSPPCVPTSVETHDARTTPTSKAINISRSTPTSRTTSPPKTTPTSKTTPISKITPTARITPLHKISPTYKDNCKPGRDAPRSEICEPAILEVGEEAFSSGEEAGEGEVSPGGSFRGSLRGSPSHRSQDSGYSDSGESTNAHNDSDGSPTTPLNVKHITRVYFGDSPEEAGLYNDKIVCSPEVTAGQVSSSSGSPSSLSSARKSPTSVHTSPGNHCAGSLEELSEELEHKSVLEAAARRTGAVRKRSTNTPASTGVNRRPQRRSNSTDKLQADHRLDNRRPTPLKARRRWSAADLQQQHQQSGKQRKQLPPADQQPPACTSRSTSTNDLPRGHQVGVAARVGGAWSLDALDDPVPAWRVAGEVSATLPRPHHARRIRIHPAAIAKEMRNGSVGQWLKELSVLYESECMNTLQSKSLPGECGRRPATSTSTSSSTRHAVRAIQRRAHAVSTEFARLCQRLEWLELRQVPALAGSLVGHINNFLRDYTTQWTSADPDLQPQSSLGRQSKVIHQICERLTEVCSNDPDGDDDLDHNTTRQVVQVVTALGHAFTKLVDLMLSREIKVVVRVLEESKEEEVSAAVSHLTALGVDGGHICRLIARLGGVRGLLGVCLEPRLSHVRVAALRALATVCCVVDGIVELEKAGGVEVVAEVLCDEDCLEEERSEAAGVLAQITSPWVENTHRLAALHAHMRPIVAALTDLAEFTRVPEVFLLASAALANLTFLDGGCVSAMRAAGTTRVLLKDARDNPNLSIFTKDQIATVLANLAGSQEAAEEVVAGGGVGVLLALLNTRPAPTHRLPEVATAERVQQKSAIAISRLCRESSVARQVVELGGAERLVRLCKDEQERNHSDAVLVACLAALRKMASSMGSEELRGMDAAELVEPRLLDSFLIYSSRQESYV
ncbi:protein inscuteable homolog [Homarus americanus]|uniref:protein inscuteable homolog n=1 Tax=Homarus americanus TaxID=6706 RepID=UPI001C47498E|nr:protein inscuteable homolog [Homarus americanus]